MIGQTISHYKILSKLGEGGMGVVYKAHDTELDRDVALKFLPHHVTVNEVEQARFLQEARAAAILNHPNICTVHAIEKADDQQFIVMECVDGKTLREIVPVKKMQDAITYAIQIAEALQEAHTHGIVHRDIKAENIMVNSKNQVKVMDFGLAKLKGSLKLTKTSSTIGTLAYMAPEQIEGGEVDARSDIFSFGIVLYEMLTGHLPFRGEHEAAMMYAIVNQDPEPLKQYVPDAPSELLHILDRALEKDREERYQTVHEMLIDLRRLKKDSARVSRQPQSAMPMPTSVPPVPTSESKKGWRKRLWLFAAGLIFLCVVAALLLLLRTHALQLNPNRTSLALRLPFKEIRYPSLSSDGKWIAFTAKDENGKWDVYTMNVTGEKAIRVTYESASLMDVGDISPDVSQIVYTCQNEPNTSPKVKLIAFQGGESRTLADTGAVPKWRPDGQRIGYMRVGREGDFPSVSGMREIWSINPDGTDNRLEVIDTVGTRGEFSAFCWSPDGGSITWVRNYREGYGEVMVRELSTGKERQLTYDKKPVDEVIWATNDVILFVSNKSGQSNLWIIPAEGGDAPQVTHGGVPISGARISTDRKTLVYLQSEEIAHIWISSINGSNAHQASTADVLVKAPSFSPDRKCIAYVLADVDLFNKGAQLCVIDRDGKNQRQLTSGLARVSSPRWSPDGKWIAYFSRALGDPPDSTKINVIQPDYPGPPRLLCKGRSLWWVSRDSLHVEIGMKTLGCSIERGLGSQVYLDSTWALPVQGTNQFVYWDYREGRDGWWVVSSDSLERLKREARRLVVVGAWATTPDLRLLILPKGDELWRVWTATGKEERIGKAIAGNAWMCDVSMDGKEILWLRNISRSKLVLVKNVFE
jgi:eukaryotic-like serine/threonine-protein kinase